MGRMRMVKSKTVLMTAVAMKSAKRLTHVPGPMKFQKWLIGVHSNRVAKNEEMKAPAVIEPTM